MSTTTRPTYSTDPGSEGMVQVILQQAREGFDGPESHEAQMIRTNAWAWNTAYQVLAQL